MEKPMQTRIVLPDLHIPFQDHHLVKAWLKHARALHPDGVDILGDLIDAYPLSRFDKNPTRKANIQSEIDQARVLLEKVRAAVGPKCDIRYSEGNHENRLTKVLWGRAKELAPLRGLRIPELLGLQDLGITYYAPEAPYKIGNLWYLHGDIARKSNWSMAAGGSGAKAVSTRIRGSVVMGHSHQMGISSFRGWDSLSEGYEAGCLCRFDLEYIVGVPQWQQGWAVVTFGRGFEGKPLYHDVNFVRVVDVRGKRWVIYRGEPIAKVPPAKRHLQ
jgi:hypothetical protein